MSKSAGRYEKLIVLVGIEPAKSVGGTIRLYSNLVVKSWWCYSTTSTTSSGTPDVNSLHL